LAYSRILGVLAVDEFLAGRGTQGGRRAVITHPLAARSDR
jgi:hypothetical protein